MDENTRDKYMAEDHRYLRSIVKEKTEQIHGNTCDSCGQIIADADDYCGNCGNALRSTGACPSCGAKTLSGADICESCGTWLLGERCRFCLEPLEDNQHFCGNCGNPGLGIQCSQCGNLSIFDFCKFCAIPLSHQAKQMISSAENDPERVELISLLKELNDTKPITSASCKNTIADNSVECAVDEQLRLIKNIRDRKSSLKLHSGAYTGGRSLFSDKQKDQINMLDTAIEKEQERVRKEEERLRKEAEERRLQEEARCRAIEEQINRALSEISEKSFTSNQEARRFFMALMAQLADEKIIENMVSDRLAWRCNAYGNVHNTPSECACPSAGGVWLLR